MVLCTGPCVVSQPKNFQNRAQDCCFIWAVCHRSTSMYQRFVMLLCLCISHHSCCWILRLPLWLLFLSFVSLSWLSSLQHKGWDCRCLRCYRLYCCSLSSGTVLLPSPPLLCLPLPLSEIVTVVVTVLEQNMIIWIILNNWHNLMLRMLIRHNSMWTYVSKSDVNLGSACMKNTTYH